MKRLLFLSFIGLFAQFLVSCYPGGADNVEEMDVAITNYDKNADFTKYTTFSLPDTIVYFVAKGETPNHEFDAQILQLVKDNFNSDTRTSNRLARRINNRVSLSPYQLSLT